MAACRSHKHTHAHLIERIIQFRLLYLLLNNYYDCMAILPKLGTKVNLPEHDWGSFAVNEQCSTACFGPGCTVLLRAPAQLQADTALKPLCSFALHLGHNRIWNRGYTAQLGCAAVATERAAVSAADLRLPCLAQTVVHGRSGMDGVCHSGCLSHCPYILHGTLCK